MKVSKNKEHIYRLVINLCFWLSFGLVVLIINWAKVDFDPLLKPQFVELENLIETKQFILLIISGFSLYGLLSFLFRRLNTQKQLERSKYFLNLALQEWASIFTNFASIAFVTGFLIENYWYWIGSTLCYFISYLIVRE